jgi:hypothetical protein
MRKRELVRHNRNQCNRFDRDTILQRNRLRARLSCRMVESDERVEGIWQSLEPSSAPTFKERNVRSKGKVVGTLNRNIWYNQV